VAFTTCSRLLAELAGGHADHSFQARVRKLAKITLLIADDFAMREFTPPRPTTSTSCCPNAPGGPARR
jgi:hypothetical protein